MARSCKWYGNSGPMSTRLRKTDVPKGHKAARRKNTKKNYRNNFTSVKSND